jgi:psiF repeat-containing protein
MHTLLGALVSIMLFAGLATAGDEKKAAAPHASRMTDCNAQAGEQKLTGDARKQFMAECLKAPAAAADDGAGSSKASSKKSAEGGHSAQAEKMKHCNQEATAKSLHGDERRQFMSQCLKGEKKS